MAKRKYPNGRALVKAVTLETLVDDAHPSSGKVNLICGHCGRMTATDCFFMYQPPEECGVPYEEQVEAWRELIAQSAVCRLCEVKNVATDVEAYMRRQRESEKRMAELFDKWEQQQDEKAHAQQGPTAPIYSFSLSGEKVSAEVRLDSQGRLVVAELRDGEPEGEAVPWREFVKDNPEWKEEVKAAARQLLSEIDKA